MGTISIKPETKSVRMKGQSVVFDNIFRKAELKKFNPRVLGLGEIGEASRRIDVIALLFDLSGFTACCSNVDAHLSMPIFLKKFLSWLFECIESELEQHRFKQGILLYSRLPFFAKFTGDGVLFLWDTQNMDERLMCNVVVLGRNVCRRYSSGFLPEMRKELSHIPKSLRCGVACGTVCSVGNGEDYIGASINIASRLVKLSSLRISISKRGLDFEKGMKEATAKRYIVKSVSIRGIGEEELVMVETKDFEALSKRDRAVFKDV